MEARPITNIRATLGEGPLWHDGAIYWTDILEKKIYRYFPLKEVVEEWPLPAYVGAFAPRKKGGFVLAMKNGFALSSGFAGDLTHIADPESGKPGSRFNDGKCDPAGRFWAGTMAMNISPGQGTLYMLDTEHRVHKKYAPVTISNGLCWSRDAKYMYYIDTPTHQILRFDFNNATGEIRDPEVIVEIDKKWGNPDGMTIDGNGCLWIALWGGGSVVCYDSKADSFVGKIHIPTAHVSSCTFGGPNLDELYITTARDGLTPQQRAKEPLAGALFKVITKVRGTPTNIFKG